MPLLRVKTIGQTRSLLSVAIVKLSSLFKQYPQQLNLRGDLHHWDKGFMGGVYYAWFIVWIFEFIFFYSKNKNILRSLFIYGANVLTHLIIPRHRKNVTWFCYIWRLSRLLLYNCLVILAWPRSSYNRGYYLFCLYQPLIEIIVIHIIWAAGVLWLYWSIKSWMEKHWRRVNNGSPIINTSLPM